MKRFILSTLLITSTISYSQSKETIQKIAKDACSCISEIDSALPKGVKSKSINECIESSIFSYQIEEKATKIAEDIKKDSLKKETTLNINTEKYRKKVEEQLHKDCSTMKDIYFSTEEAHENSFSDKEKAREYYDMGIRATEQNNIEKAIKYYKTAVESDSKFAFAWDNLGYSYRKINEFDKAVECYKKSLALDPKGKMPLMNIAVALQLSNKNDEAKKYYRIYKDYYKDDPESYYGIGRIFFFEKNYEPALENMIKAYGLYKKMNSPYYTDAEKHIAFIYNEYKKKGKLEEFTKLAEKFGLKIN